MPLTEKQKKGQVCEKAARRDYESRGYSLIPLSKGGDMLAIKKGKPLEILEAKCGYKSGLTKNERTAAELAKRIGIKYTMYYCECDL